jgi:hypothetical protein
MVLLLPPMGIYTQPSSIETRPLYPWTEPVPGKNHCRCALWKGRFAKHPVTPQVDEPVLR